MPVVRYGQPRVATERLPGVRRTAAETALSRGAGLHLERARTSETIAGVAGSLANTGLSKMSEIAREEREKADQVALLEAENRLSEWEQKRLYDPETGALGVKGKAAMSLPDDLRTEFDQLAGTIEQELATDAQRLAFTQARTRRLSNLDLTIRRHVFREMEAHEAKEVGAAVINHLNDGIANALDPRRVGVELQAGIDVIRAHPMGAGPEELQQRIDDFTTKMHDGVITRLLANDQARSAQVYFEETREQISGDAIARIEKALEAGGLRKEAQVQADAIVRAGGTLTEQREKARLIEQPELRDAVMQRIEHEASIRERETRQAEEDQLRTAYDLVDRYQDVAAIPPATWAELSGAARSSLRGYARNLAQGIPVETDFGTYYSLMRQAAEDPQAFSTRNLLEARGKLDDGDFKQLAGLQLSIRNGDRAKANADLNGFRTTNAIVNDTLSLFGVDPAAKPGTEEGRAIAQLQRMLDQRIEQFAQSTGKQPNNSDIQTMLDALLSTTVETPGSWWNIFPGGKAGPWGKDSKRLIDLTISDVPRAERKLIEEALRGAGRPVSDATILDLYLETQARVKGGR